MFLLFLLLLVKWIGYTISTSSVILLMLNDAEKVPRILSAVNDQQAVLLRATREGMISYHVDDLQKNQFLDLIAPYLSLQDQIITTSVPDIQVKNGWKRRRRDVVDFDLESYNTYESIYEYLQKLAKTYPDLCELQDIGTTFENRPIRLMKIHGRQVGRRRARVFMDAAQHAREWLTTATLLQIIRMLITNYKNGDRWTVSLLDRYEFHIIPLVNPDGYEYTYKETALRFWRKNKKNATVDVSCIGVDLNRNWGFQWSGQGGSKNKCSDLYFGPAEFSEEETKAMSNYILQYKGTWHSYFSFHNFGQMLLFPWSHTTLRSEDYDKHFNASKQMALGIKELSNTSYSCGTVAGVLYAASGSSESWAYSVAGIPYAYTLELPDLITFVINASRIRPTALEIMNGFKYYFTYIEETQPNLYAQIIRNITKLNRVTLPDVLLDLTTIGTNAYSQENTTPKFCGPSVPSSVGDNKTVLSSFTVPGNSTNDTMPANNCDRCQKDNHSEHPTNTAQTKSSLNEYFKYLSYFLSICIYFFT